MKGIVLIWLIFCHSVALWLFSHGFLLTRIVVDDISDAQSIKPTFNRTVILIIDALRYDFTTPQADSSALYHNNLVVMHQIASRYPERAFLLPFIADPPTTTLQRLKGLTTGSLPTFIDAGSNFAGTEILEDNLLLQLRKAGKRLAFVGDDTWAALFPNSFEQHLNRPFPSLNVWDLDTVDDGVYEHLFKYLEKPKEWDIAVAHCLGVDHVGHRYGPDHPEMARKQNQMNDWIIQLMDTIDDETLLVVMGDHGMNPLGDHGGDSELELEAALWMYSRKDVFGTVQRAQSRTAQIDLVPTLSTLWGLPTPFSNLGSPIPEAFINAATTWQQALGMTTKQIQRYIAAYNKQPIDLSPVADDIAYQRLVLEQFRQQWAQYDLPSIFAGIFLMMLGLLATICARPDESMIRPMFAATCGAMAGPMLAPFIELRALHAGFFFSISAGVLAQCWRRPTTFQSLNIPASILFALHLATFTSNSFTIFEDRIVLFLLNSSACILLFKSFRISNKSSGILSALQCLAFMGLSRIAASIRLCREEQGDKCVSNFYATNLATPGIRSLWLLALVAVMIPLILRKALVETQSWWGSSVWIIGVALPAQMVFGLGFWIMNYLEFDNDTKVLIGRTTIGIAFIAITIWCFAPLSIRLSAIKQNKSTALVAHGMNNAMGSSYLQLCAIVLGLLSIIAKPMGGIALSILSWQVVLLADILGRCRIQPSAMLACVMLVLLGHLHFFATGHQMALPFIQWDIAFLASASPTWYSPALVVANAFSGPILVVLCVPLLALWKRPPGSTGVQDHVFLVTTTIMALCLTLTLSTAIFATHFRRHLMVWKIFAPRFMCAAQILLLTDVVLAIACFSASSVISSSTRLRQALQKTLSEPHVMR